MENRPFEDVSPRNGDFPGSHVWQILGDFAGFGSVSKQHKLLKLTTVSRTYFLPTHRLEKIPTWNWGSIIFGVGFLKK